MPPKVEFEQIDEPGSMVHSVISCSLGFHGKGCCDPSTIGDYTLSFNRLYFLSCTVRQNTDLLVSVPHFHDGPAPQCAIFGLIDSSVYHVSLQTYSLTSHICMAKHRPTPWRAIFDFFCASPYELCH